MGNFWNFCKFEFGKLNLTHDCALRLEPLLCTYISTVFSCACRVTYKANIIKIQMQAEIKCVYKPVMITGIGLGPDF